MQYALSAALGKYVSINKEEEIKEENGIIVSLDTKITEELKTSRATVISVLNGE